MNELFIGVDLHKKQFTVYIMNGKEEGIYNQFNTDLDGFSSFISQIKLCLKEGFKVKAYVFFKGRTI